MLNTYWYVDRGSKKWHFSLPSLCNSFKGNEADSLSDLNKPSIPKEENLSQCLYFHVLAVWTTFEKFISKCFIQKG